MYIQKNSRSFREQPLCRLLCPLLTSVDEVKVSEVKKEKGNTPSSAEEKKMSVKRRERFNDAKVKKKRLRGLTPIGSKEK